MIGCSYSSVLFCYLNQELANYGLWAYCGHLHVSVNQVLLEYSHIHALSYVFTPSTPLLMAPLSHYNSRTEYLLLADIFITWPFTEKCCLPLILTIFICYIQLVGWCVSLISNSLKNPKSHHNRNILDHR